MAGYHEIVTNQIQSRNHVDQKRLLHPIVYNMRICSSDLCQANVSLLKLVNDCHKLRVSASYMHGQGLKCWFDVLKWDKGQEYYKPGSQSERLISSALDLKGFLNTTLNTLTQMKETVHQIDQTPSQAVGGSPVLALVVGESIRVEELSGTTFASEEFAERHHDNE